MPSRWLKTIITSTRPSSTKIRLTIEFRWTSFVSSAVVIVATQQQQLWQPSLSRYISRVLHELWCSYWKRQNLYFRSPHLRTLIVLLLLLLLGQSSKPLSTKWFHVSSVYSGSMYGDWGIRLKTTSILGGSISRSLSVWCRSDFCKRRRLEMRMAQRWRNDAAALWRWWWWCCWRPLKCEQKTKNIFCAFAPSHVLCPWTIIWVS